MSLDNWLKLNDWHQPSLLVDTQRATVFLCVQRPTSSSGEVERGKMDRTAPKVLCPCQGRVKNILLPSRIPSLESLSPASRIAIQCTSLPLQYDARL